MINIVEVKTKKQQKIFVNYPNNLYKNNPFYVPSFFADEMAMFDPNKNANYKDCDSIFYLAYNQKGEVVGRINGIIQHAYNQKTNTRRARFGRFDCINDLSVAKALFAAVETWAKKLGMEIIHGPLGYNDLQREGLLIKGFDQVSTFATAYNHEYYSDLLQKCKYEKEIDTVEYKITVPQTQNEQIKSIAAKVAQKHGLKVVKVSSINKLLKLYSTKIFSLLNTAYEPLYGVVPITEKLKEQLIAQFKIIVQPSFVSLVVNENDNVVGFGLVFPDITKPMQKSKGKVLTRHIFSLLKTIKNPNKIEMALIAVEPNYRTKGVAAIVLNDLHKKLIDKKITLAESNPELETNYKVQNIWNGFDRVNHKQRRFYIKALKEGITLSNIKYRGENIDN